MTSKVRNEVPQRWVISDWHYWPDSGRLKKQGAEQKIPIQLNQILQLLVNHAPAVVTREQFLDIVWSGKVVNEDALSRAIAELRKILGDSANQAKYIKTIPKQGYQLAGKPMTYVAKKQKLLQKFSLFLFFVFLLLTLITQQQDHRSNTLIQAVANAKRITSKPGMEQQSMLSEDGKWLTFATNTQKESFITVLSLENTNIQHEIRLTDQRLASPIYDSPNNQLWFLAKQNNSCQLISRDLDSEQLKIWSDCDFEVESRTLNADFKNNAVYFSKTTPSQKTAIHHLDIFTGQISQVTSPMTDNTDWSPDISPNGKWLSFSRGNHSVRNIWMKDLENGVEKIMTEGEHYSVSHDWLNDDFIVFDSDQSGSRQLWVLKINDGFIEAVGGYGAQHPSVDAKGEILTFQKVNYEANIWQHDLVTNEFTRVVHSTKYDNNPAYAPDGSKFAFTSNRQDVGSIWIYDFKQSKEQLLLSIENTKLTRPYWSQDGKNVLLTANDESGYWSLAYDLVTKSYEKIAFNMAHLETQQHNGIYYALAKAKTLSNQIIRLDGGRQSVLPIKNVSRFMLLADGRIIFTKSDEIGLFLADPDNFTEKVLVRDFALQSINLWTVRNESVYFDQAGDDPGIFRLDVKQMNIEKVSEHRPFSVGTSLSVHPLENAILITRTDRAESDVFKTSLK